MYKVTLTKKNITYLNFLAKNDTDLPICTSSEQYMKYRQLGENLSHASSDNYWDLIGCTPRCKFTKYKLKPMVEGTNDENKIMMKKPDGANIEVNSKDTQKIDNYQKFDRFFFPVQDLILLSRNRIETENSDL